jgi:hypothetical protein
MDSIRQQARAAGRLYLLLAVSAPFGLLYVPARLIVRGDATATADNIRASPWLLHAGMGSELFHQAVVIFVAMALYRLFRPVDDAQAKLVVILGALVSVPIAFLNVLNEVAALALVGGAPYFQVFAKPQLDALAYLFMHLHGRGLTIASIFWGLWLFPLGTLAMRSGFIPRILGVLLIAAGTGYLATASATLVVPRYAALVEQIASPLYFGELPFIVWLVIWGARTGRNAESRLGSAIQAP